MKSQGGVWSCIIKVIEAMIVIAVESSSMLDCCFFLYTYSEIESGESPPGPNADMLWSKRYSNVKNRIGDPRSAGACRNYQSCDLPVISTADCQGYIMDLHGEGKIDQVFGISRPGPTLLTLCNCFFHSGVCCKVSANGYLINHS